MRLEDLYTAYQQESCVENYSSGEDLDQLPGRGWHRATLLEISVEQEYVKARCWPYIIETFGRANIEQRYRPCQRGEGEKER